ncbi:GPW/gp25 family protein [Pseudonocardia xinjiangensis]|uniref:GPW/gp25 family protein n=1 Tax=Pseudonocardia xinjiangensis TaxID=75289 RepID=UPI003D8F6CE8
MSGAFVGTGWSFPMHTMASGGIALSRGEGEIVEAIRLILSTAPGERPMRPEFGCGVHDLAFDPMNPTTAGRVRFEVMASLERWEPRIEVLDVVVTADDDDAATLLIDIEYEIRGTNNPRNLVFPFYVIPPDESEV